MDLPVATRAIIQSVFLLLLSGPFFNAPTAWAGKYNSDISIGDESPSWKDLPGVDDKAHSLSDLAAKDVVVVVFTCNSCPYAIDYEDRINRLAEKHSAADSRVAVVAINVNRIDADALPAMKKRAQDKAFRFAYLYDESQSIAKKFGAVRTPEFFVLNKQRRIVYMGAMDDNTKESLVKTRYVDDAIRATLEGTSIEVQETPPVGCGIRFARERKK